MTKKLHPVVKALRKASRLIEKGWTQNSFSERINKTDHFCAFGAVDTAALRESKKALEYVQAALPKPWTSVIDFNDHPQRKHSDVKKLLKRAIKMAEEATK